LVGMLAFWKLQFPAPLYSGAFWTRVKTALEF
jgi:hypothetical protein